MVSFKRTRTELGPSLWAQRLRDRGRTVRNSKGKAMPSYTMSARLAWGTGVSTHALPLIIDFIYYSKSNENVMSCRRCVLREQPRVTRMMVNMMTRQDWAPQMQEGPTQTSALAGRKEDHELSSDIYPSFFSTFTQWSLQLWAKTAPFPLSCFCLVFSHSNQESN